MVNLLGDNDVALRSARSLPTSNAKRDGEGNDGENVHAYSPARREAPVRHAGGGTPQNAECPDEHAGENLHCVNRLFGVRHDCTSLGKKDSGISGIKDNHISILLHLCYFVNSIYYFTDMKLIVGLGNPETRYENTRHNTGFMALDRFAKTHDATFAAQKKFKAEAAELTLHGEKVLLLKPQTYYNLSGEAVRATADFYKITPADVLIIHDELMLPFGTVRTRIGGSDAGNNGIKSINQHMGNETTRIRVGVSNSTREHIDDVNFVLGKFTGEEQADLPQLLELADKLIEQFVSGNFETTTHR